jgi:radical SAM protein with 4Fe4S-binding SPASM domain
VKKDNHYVYHVMISLGYSCNISCDCCFVGGMKEYFPKFISLENFKKAIKWLKKQDINHVCLTGGEPTTHPQFDEIIKICKEKNIIVNIITNGLFDSGVLDVLTKDFVRGITVHYFNPGEKNLEKQKYNTNLKKITEKEIPLSLFCILPIHKKYYPDIVQKVKDHNARIFGHFLIPGFQGKKESLIEKRKKARSVLDFQKIIEKEDIRFELVDVALRCAFSDEEWEFLVNYNKNNSSLAASRCFTGYSLESKHALPHTKERGNKSNYAMRLFINSDLSIFPCLTVFSKGPNILSFKNIEEVSNLLKKFFEKWRWQIPMEEECKNCKYFLSKECQGGCLHHKYNKYYRGKIINIEEII